MVARSSFWTSYHISHISMILLSWYDWMILYILDSKYIPKYLGMIPQERMPVESKWSWGPQTQKRVKPSWLSPVLPIAPSLAIGEIQQHPMPDIWVHTCAWCFLRPFPKLEGVIFLLWILLTPAAAILVEFWIPKFEIEFDPATWQHHSLICVEKKLRCRHTHLPVKGMGTRLKLMKDRNSARKRRYLSEGKSGFWGQRIVSLGPGSQGVVEWENDTV